MPCWEGGAKSHSQERRGLAMSLGHATGRGSDRKRCLLLDGSKMFQVSICSVPQNLLKDSNDNFHIFRMGLSTNQFWDVLGCVRDRCSLATFDQMISKCESDHWPLERLGSVLIFEFSMPSRRLWTAGSVRRP